MAGFLVRRLLQILPTLIMISIAAFIIIQLPPGDYLTTLRAQLELDGGAGAREYIEGLRRTYGFDRPMYVQYFMWIRGFIRGDFGWSFEHQADVAELIREPLTLDLFIAATTILFTWVVAIPIGVYSATHKYSLFDNLFTGLGFMGLAIPHFLIALVFLVASVYVFGTGYTGGLFSPGMQYEPWGLKKIIDLLHYLWIPVVIIGLRGVAELIRVMRGNLMDILEKQYIRTARAKGLSEWVVIFKHAVKVAINPLISIAGMQMPRTISGGIIIGIVLNLPTTGPLLYRALRSQDMYLSGTILMFLAALLVVGNLIADVALAFVDPRIRYD